jgi:hypothetical protein
MSHTLDQFEQQRDVVLRDDVERLPAGDRDALLAQAIVQRYSKDRPRELATDVAGNGTSLLALPSSGSDVFEEGFSIIKSIELPVGQIPPEYIADDEFRLYRTPAGLKILLLQAVPAASDTLRINWTARHKADGSTVPDPDFEAVCDLAAAFCYEALAGIYTQTGDPSIAADTVNYRTKNQEYMSLAKTAAKRYFNHLGIDPSDTSTQTGPAIATGSMHENMGWGGDRLTHSKVTR